VAVLYAGRIVESCTVEEFFARPRHPYSQALLKSVILDPGLRRRIDGERPDPRNLPAGCYFHPRCGLRVQECSNRRPRAAIVATEHTVACHVVEKQGVISDT
jgi:oligopeptide/dipeptide ABC transporter ATP-binding protein